MTQNILITGASGFIGQKLFKKLQGPSVYGTIMNAPLSDPHLLRVDLSNGQETARILRELKPSVVFHFSGLTSPKRNTDNPETSQRSHTESLENILNNIDPKNCHLIFLSTDKVFDGSEPNPDENSQAKPTGIYGELKLKCEELIKERMTKYHIVRLSLVHSNGDESSTSVIDKSILKIKNKEPVQVFKNVSRCFADVNQLVDVLEKLMKDTHYGLYHYGSKLVSYYDRIVEICEKNGIEYQGKLEGVNGEIFPLVQNLNTDKIRALKL